eukprot:1758557-Pyramimonas_sp.AAC.1
MSVLFFCMAMINTFLDRATGTFVIESPVEGNLNVLIRRTVTLLRDSLGPPNAHYRSRLGWSSIRPGNPRSKRVPKFDLA